MEANASIPTKHMHTAEPPPWSLHKEDVKNSLEKSNQRQCNTSFQTGKRLLQEETFWIHPLCYSKCSALRGHKKACNLYQVTAIHLHYILPHLFSGYLRYSSSRLQWDYMAESYHGKNIIMRELQNLLNLKWGQLPFYLWFTINCNDIKVSWLNSFQNTSFWPLYGHKKP